MRFLILVVTFLIPSVSFAECNFRTADHLEFMMSPAAVKSISIEIPKSSKFARNQFKILTSRSKNIPNKLKKKFKANITINYDFGVCQYLGKIRQSGDWKDHIGFVNGKPIQSLDVTLKTGNVVGATKFKLLIPDTRYGRNEVLGALILRELNYIAPETFEVKVSVNGVQSLMIFQEKSEKELLERNLRREGPIFEGDESLLWSYNDYSNFELTPLALSRLKNNNWFKKGNTSQKIVIKSFYRLQNAYFDYAHSVFLKKNRYFLKVNNKEDYFFNDYHRLLLAMSGKHALAPHNRQFYFNAIEDRFEPIYYDGDLRFSTFVFEENFGLEFYLKEKVSPDLTDRVTKLLTSKDLLQKYSKRIKTASADETFYKKSINQLIKNLKLFDNMLFSNGELESPEKHAENSWYVNFQKEKNLQQYIVDRVELQKNSANLYLADDLIKTVSVSDLSKVLSKIEINNERFVIIPQSESVDGLRGYKELIIGRNLVRTSGGVDIVFDEKNKKLELIQAKASDWVLFLGGDYSDWDIKFRGNSDVASISSADQRFNDFGLTGCLTFYKTIINKTRIDVSGGKCEDSLNLFRVQGTNVQVIIKDAFADGLDADFSNLNISYIEIKNAGNDCLDFSGGEYSTTNARFENCADKAIPIGEMSSYEGKNIHIRGANIGISSKDFSNAKVKSFDAKDVSICGEAKQKKQEFGGGFLVLKNFNCAGKFSIDEESSVSLGDM